MAPLVISQADAYGQRQVECTLGGVAGSIRISSGFQPNACKGSHETAIKGSKKLTRGLSPKGFQPQSQEQSIRYYRGVFKPAGASSKRTFGNKRLNVESAIESLLGQIRS